MTARLLRVSSGVLTARCNRPVYCLSFGEESITRSRAHCVRRKKRPNVVRAREIAGKLDFGEIGYDAEGKSGRRLEAGIEGEG